MKATITIPDNLNEITLSQYQEFCELPKELEGELLNQKIVEIFCVVPFSNVKLILHKDIKDIADSIKTLLAKEVEFKHRFKIKSQEFGFITELEEITSGEFADLCAYSGKPAEMHKAMAVMFRPVINRVGQNYEIFPYKGTKEFSDVMKFMPLGIAFGAHIFFWNLTNDLLSATQNYTTQETQEMIQAQFPALGKNGAFMEASTHLQKEILETLML